MTRQEAIDKLKRLCSPEQMTALRVLVPELQESEDERIRKEMINYFYGCREDSRIIRWISYLERQKEQKPVMIQWTGKNLKEVIDFTGKSPKFGEWFKSWEDFENYVHNHDDILKLFCEDGSHYEVPVGAWIVNTPDGYNIPSRSRFVQKLAEWSEEDDACYNLVLREVEENRRNQPQYSWHFNRILNWYEGRYKLLRPQPQWKPSEEQMKALLSKLPVVKGSGDKVQDILESLYNDLKKLM